MGREKRSEARQYFGSCANDFESFAAREDDPYVKAELLQQAAAYRKLCTISQGDINGPRSGIGSKDCRSEARQYLESCANGFEALAARDVDPYAKVDLLHQAAAYRKLLALSDRDDNKPGRGGIPKNAKSLSTG